MLPVNGTAKFRYIGYEESDYGDRVAAPVYESDYLPASMSRNWEFSNDAASSILSISTEFTILRVRQRDIQRDDNLETLFGNPDSNQDGFTILWRPRFIKITEPFEYTVQEFRAPIPNASMRNYRFVMKRRYGNS